MYNYDSQFRGKVGIMEGGQEGGKKKERLKNNLNVSHIFCIVLDDFRTPSKYYLETVMKTSQRHLYSNESMIANHVPNLSCTFTCATVVPTF